MSGTAPLFDCVYRGNSSGDAYDRPLRNNKAYSACTLAGKQQGLSHVVLIKYVVHAVAGLAPMQKLPPARPVLTHKHSMHSTPLRLHSKHEACWSMPGSMSSIPLASQAPSGNCPSVFAFVPLHRASQSCPALGWLRFVTTYQPDSATLQ